MVSELRDVVAERLAASAGTTIAFMEGFLLYAPPGSDHVLRRVHEQIALPLFLPASYENVKARREGRSGYVTIGPAPEESETAEVGEKGGEVDLEGEDDRPPQNFWVDPPGYVDDVVWPRYVEDHAWLLVPEGDEGDLVKRIGSGLNVRRDVGVKVVPEGEVDLETMLKWAVEEVLGAYSSGYR